MSGVPKTAMVLAAGLGTRMRPLTDKRPKALVEVAGRALIDHVLDRLAAAGVARAVVNLHHHADRLRAHLAARGAPRIELSDETELLLDTGGGVRRALPLLGDAPFIVANADALWLDGVDDTFAVLSRAWSDAAMDALLLMQPTVGALGYGGLGDYLLDPLGRLCRRSEHEVVPFLFAGIQILAPDAFENAPDGPFSLNLIYDRAQAAGRLFGVRHEGLWAHVGAPDAIGLAERMLKGL